jgi:hypothetical protein
MIPVTVPGAVFVQTHRRSNLRPPSPNDIPDFEITSRMDNRIYPDIFFTSIKREKA